MVTGLPRIVPMPSVNNAGWRAVGTDDAYRYTATTLSVYWPEAEHRRLIERWPHQQERLTLALKVVVDLQSVDLDKWHRAIS
jgi:hypothetical protein